MPIDPPRPLACPCCASREFSVVDEVNLEMSIANQAFQTARNDVPRFELWTCVTCGRTEVFAMDPAKMFELPYARRVVTGHG